MNKNTRLLLYQQTAYHTVAQHNTITLTTYKLASVGTVSIK